jgi:hypothetical protein
MFCPSCGTESTGLNYCNRCGANLGPLTTQTEIVQINLTKAAVMIGIILLFLTLGGFGLLVGGARALASVVTGSDPLIAMIMMGMIVILTVDIFLLRQLTKLINAALGSASTKGKRNQIAPAINAPQLQRGATGQIFPTASVTENTTRFLEEAYRAPSEINASGEKLEQ